MKVKGKASSTKPPDHDTVFSENKSSHVYIVTNKTKVKDFLNKEIFNSTERFNASCFYATTKKNCGTKHCEIKIVNRKPKIARIAKLEILLT